MKVFDIFKRHVKGALCIFCSTLVFSGCTLDLTSKKTAIDYSKDAKDAADENYILVEKSNIEIGAEHSGKKAYLVKVNSGSKTESPYDTGYISSSARFAAVEDHKTQDRHAKTSDESSSSETFTESKNSFGRINVPPIAPNIPMGRRTPSNSRMISPSYTARSYSVGDGKLVYIATEKNGSRTRKTATLKASGSHCNIWYIPSSKSIIDTSKMNFSLLAEKFDSVYPHVVKVFGKNESYMDYSNLIKVTSADKVDFLVYDIFSDADIDSPNSGTFGFFAMTDLFKNSELTDKTSNEGQTLHIDSWIFQNAPEEMYSTCVHEFQHLLNFIQKQMNSFHFEPSTWFQEMLSTLSEEIFGETLGIPEQATSIPRLPWFCTGNSFGFGKDAWNYFSEIDFSGTFDYANTFAFGSYLMHNYGGVPLIHQIATNSYYEEEAITEALKSLGYTETFKTVLFKFAQVVANTDGAPEFKSFKRSIAPDSDYGIRVNPIDLSSYNAENFRHYKYCVEKNFIVAQENTYSNSFPYIYKGSTLINLMQYGISVHYIGTVGEYGSSASFVLPSTDDVKMYIMLK